MRDVVLGGIESARRAELHLRAAAVFEERLAVDPSLHAVVADHLESGWARARGGCRGALGAGRSEGPAGAGLRRGGAGVSPAPDGGGRLTLRNGPRCSSRRASACCSPETSRRPGRASCRGRRWRGPSTLRRPWPERSWASAQDRWHGRSRSRATEQAALVADALELLPDGAAELRSMLLARLSVSGRHAPRRCRRRGSGRTTPSTSRNRSPTRR